MKRPLLVLGVAAVAGLLGSAAMSVTAGAQPTPSVKPTLQVAPATQAIARARASLPAETKLRIARASPGLGQITAANLESSFKLSPSASIIRQSGSVMAHLSLTNATSVVSAVSFEPTDVATFKGDGLVSLIFKGVANRGYLVDCTIEASVMGFSASTPSTNFDMRGNVSVNANHASFVIPKQTTANTIFTTVRGTPLTSGGTWSFFGCEFTPIN